MSTSQACTCHGDQYNQFCPQHGLNGYYARQDGALGEPSRGAPDCNHLNMQHSIAPGWSKCGDCGKTFSPDPDRPVTIRDPEVARESERTALLEALKRIHEVALRTTPPYAASALVRITELAEAAIRKAEGADGDD